MARIEIFAPLDELKRIIVDFAMEHRLQILVYSGTSNRGVYQSPDDFIASKKMSEVFLVPEDNPKIRTVNYDKIQPPEWGWISVTLGGLTRVEKKPTLILSELSCEKAPKIMSHCQRWLATLQRKLKKVLPSGVQGYVMDSGITRDYKSILYTNSALAIISDLGCWKQFRLGNVFFRPIPSTSSIAPITT